MQLGSLTTLSPQGRIHLRVGLITLACFLLGSTGWLLWLHHLTGLVAASSVDVLTMVVGYFMQAIGIGAFMFFSRGSSEARMRHQVALSVPAYVICLVPTTLSTSLAPVLAFGYLTNLLCGYMQGYYVYCLARHVSKSRRGLVFGAAYAASTALGWLLSAIGGGMLVRGAAGLVACVAIATVTVVLLQSPLTSEAVKEMPATDGAPDQRLALLACLVVLLMSLTKSAGFAFPADDLLEGVSVETSRLFYGVGLLAAGLVCDRDRRYGALCCAGALVTPFFMLALSGAAAPATIMWALGYLLFGFFSIFRVVLLADLASQGGWCLFAGAGLLFGRLGDSLGTALTTMLSGMPLALITVVSVVFACTMALFFVLYQRLYVPTADATPTERQVFERFASQHDLSSREREVLRLVLDKRSNAEIASELFVSEATVKFHVRNLLKKTGCKNRIELFSLYAES